MCAGKSRLRPGRWPRKLRLAFEAIVTVFMNSYQAARSRAAGSPSKTVRLLAELDEANWQVGLLERELAIQRRRIEAVAPERRPRILADDRPQTLVLTEMLGLSLKQAAKRFVLHRNTLSRWWRVLRGSKDPDGFLGAAPFNKIGDSVRWLVHEFRDACHHLDWGSRTIAHKIVQLGIAISRTSVQRILREEKPKRPVRTRTAAEKAPSRATGHILHPRKRNRTHHLDLTTLDIFGMRFHVAALLDGFSRKLLALKVYARTPTAAMMAALVKRVAGQIGAAPRFIVTDHGPQFLARFERLIAPLEDSTDVIRCRVGDWHLAGKVERLFRTFKWWARRKLWAWFASRTAIARAMQRRVDAFLAWYNERPHQGLGGRMPNQVWAGVKRLKTRPIRAHEPQPEFTVTRRRFRGDSHLAVVDVTIDWPKVA